MNAERVIFRTYKDPYKPKNTPCFLAAFPDDDANPGNIAAVPFWFDGHGTSFFEPYTEVSDAFYYGTKIIHSYDFRIRILLNVLSQYYGTEFTPCDKRTRKRGTRA